MNENQSDCYTNYFSLHKNIWDIFNGPIGLDIDKFS